MIVATRPLIDCCPVVPAAMEGRQLVQWDKDSCADAGFLKIDLLGLGMLSAVERTVELIARTRGERIDLSRIPFDDPATFAAIQRAETTGVFQIESRAQMQSLRRTRPENLEELAIQVAIIRPGPIQGGAVNPYIERRQRLREDPAYEPPCLHPSLAGVLRETLGTIIFQDQVLEVAQAFAGFGPGEADGLRRAMSRKRASVAIERYRRRFIEGAAAHVGAAEALAQRVWEMVAGFAGFGFPKAHSAAFGLLAYQSTWLRVHYGPEFLCALLNEQPMGFYPPDSLAHEAQRRGIALRGGRRQRLRRPSARSRRAARCGSGSATCAACAREEVAALVARPRGGRAVRERRRARRARARGARLARAARLVGRLRRARRPVRAGPRAPQRAVGARRRDPRPARARRRPSSRSHSTAARPRHLRELGRWEALLADYATSGVTLTDHALAILRPRLDGVATSAGARAPPPRRAGHGRRPRRRAPAPRDRERRRLHAARGRARHGQPDRPPRALRAPPPRRPRRAADPRRGPPRAPARRAAARSTCSCASCAPSTPSSPGSSHAPIARLPAREADARRRARRAGRALRRRRRPARRRPARAELRARAAIAPEHRPPGAAARDRDGICAISVAPWHRRPASDQRAARPHVRGALRRATPPCRRASMHGQ